jgi:hypothetical protein
MSDYVEGRTVHNVPDPMDGKALGIWVSAEWWGNALGRLADRERKDEALRERIAAGHNDTCSFELGARDGRYKCDCGHDACVRALAGREPDHE